MPELLRKGHFLGAKLRALRKRNGLTLEELSVRCIQRDTERAPSVSYLSMIESGKRTPSSDLLELLAGVFQRPVTWFLDESADLELQPALPGGAATRVPLEPAFLFSKSLLQAAIPELLVQTGTTGRQFAHLLIRSHQEMSRNDFPDLERAADGISERRFPLAVDDLMRLCKRHGLEIRWFDRKPVLARDKDRELRSMVRSFFEAPRVDLCEPRAAGRPGAAEVRPRRAHRPQGAARGRRHEVPARDRRGDGRQSRRVAPVPSA